jgi:DNA invertase Pin-like site-specific DNA recombinase
MSANSQAFIYARVSSKEQEEEGFSIPAQLKLLREYAERNGLRVIREFTDAETAKQTGRPGFEEMVAFLKQHPHIKVILVEKTDRLYRNFRDYVTIDDLDVEIHLVKEGEVLSKDSKSHQKFIHGIKVLMAKNYIDNLSEEVKKGLNEKAEQGEYPSIAPLGYRNNLETHTIEPKEPEASVIQKLFKLYATGNFSIRKLRDIAFEEGLTGRRSNRKLSRSEIERILKNPIYYGEFIWKGKRYKGTHTPLITRSLFDAVQEVFAGFKKAKERRHWFPVSGVVTCSRCSCAIVGETHKGKYTYYRCTHHHGKCGQPYVRAETLDAKLLEIVRRAELDQERLNWLKAALLESHQDERAYHEAQITALRAHYDRLQQRIERIYLDKLDGAVNEDFWKARTAEWRSEQDRIQAQLVRHQQANQNYLETGVRILELTKDIEAQYVRANVAQKRQILSILLSNCALHDVTLTPAYRKPFCWIAEGLLSKEWRGRRGSN